MPPNRLQGLPQSASKKVERGVALPLSLCRLWELGGRDSCAGLELTLVLAKLESQSALGACQHVDSQSQCGGGTVVQVAAGAPPLCTALN